VRAPGTRAAEFRPAGAADDAFAATLASVLADRDDALLAAYVDDGGVPYSRLREALAVQSKQALLHPVYFGSAITGAGVGPLMSGIAGLLPAAVGDVQGPVSGTVFKIERGPAGEKIAYVRMFTGTVRTRDSLPFGPDAEGKVTAISVFDGGAAVSRQSVSAGEIGKLWGLGEIQIGDSIGTPRTATEHHFAPPTLETVVVPARPPDKGALRVALAQLAEQDPLINVRQDDTRQEMSVSLYGEVQKEVIQATLANDFDLEVGFRESTTICIERPVGTGTAVELLGEAPNPFLATIGLRIEPAPIDTGVRYQVEREVLGTLPLTFFRAVEETVKKTLEQGVHGWQVIDCLVTMTHTGYCPVTTARDFRLLTPLVLMTALEEAGTVVCEPIHRFRLEFPADTIGAVSALLARLGAVPQTSSIRGSGAVLEGDVAAARVNELQQQLRAPTRGEGALESAFDRYEPVRGAPPTRPRWDHNPLNRKEYLLRITRRV
jgi:ribosomal protection tetracycline resistance protein